MQRLFKQLSLMLVASTVPTVALAQSIGATPDLSIGSMASAPDYRLRFSIGHLGTPPARQTAMLERLFVPSRGFGTADHRHTASFAIGEVQIVAQAMRERMRIAAGGIRQGAHAHDRFSAVGIEAGLPLGADDGLSLGVAANMSKRAEPAILAGHKSIDGEAIAADCTWAHGAHLRMSLGWRADRVSGGGVNRMVELAEGAPLREQGFRLALNYLVAGADASRATTFGIAARDARIAADDLAMIGSASRRDVETALFVRRAF